MIWHFMQIVSIEDNFHEMSSPVSWKNISKCQLLKILPRMLSITEGVFGDNLGIYVFKKVEKIILEFLISPQNYAFTEEKSPNTLNIEL